MAVKASWRIILNCFNDAPYPMMPLLLLLPPPSPPAISSHSVHLLLLRLVLAAATTTTTAVKCFSFASFNHLPASHCLPRGERHAASSGCGTDDCACPALPPGVLGYAGRGVWARRPLSDSTRPRDSPAGPHARFAKANVISL